MVSTLLQSKKKSRLYNWLVSCCTVIALAAMPLFAKAQLPTTAAAYPFVYSSKTFTYITGTAATGWYSTSTDDNAAPGVPIGFPFTFCGTVYTTVTPSTNGFMAFGTIPGSSGAYNYPAYQSYIASIGPLVMAGWHDAAAGTGSSLSNVTYETTGTAPNRIFTLQFKDWASCCGISPFISYQYRLYEGGAVEVIYDAVGSGNFGSMTAIGIARTTSDFQTLNNTSAAPVSSSATFNNTTISGTKPVTGQSYLWGLIPCKGTPEFNIAGPTQVCPGKEFSLTLSGTSIISELTYQWQYSNDGVTWINVLGGNANTVFDVITSTRWYRAVITCTNSGLTYTTPAWKMDIAQFMYCYCDNGAAVATGLDIGNFTVIELSPVYASKADTILNNGLSTPASENTTANKTYTSFQNSLSPVVMYRDSVYALSVGRISSTKIPIKDANVSVFIDLNRNGVFDATERVFKKQINNLSLIANTEIDTFTVPAAAQIGLTGMRVIMRDGPADSCGFSGEGETEDYIVDMRYEPCNGPVNAGSVSSLDTSLCTGYDYIVLDSNFEKKKSEISRFWQVSGDNVSWTNVTGSSNKDSLMRVFTGQPLYYRVRAICEATNDTTYATPLLVNAKAGYKCYCYSQATGGRADSSDIGGFTIGTYSVVTGGPHLLNTDAFRKRTDHTDAAAYVLDIDSTYTMIVYHTLRSAEHGDAKITIFMDFDNDKEYDAPYERVFTGYTSVGNFTIADNVTIPATVITGLETGMRVVLNNNLAPNLPSDEACGAYTSGETEDFMVKFVKNPFPAGIANTNVTSFSMFPNPSKGKFTLQFGSIKAVSDVDVTIATITGQEVYHHTYTHGGGQFSQQIDAGNIARGVYMVTLRTDGEKLMKKLVIE